MTDNLLALKGFANKFVPISRFNRGEAAKIFDEVSQSGVKVVLKNNEPVAVIIEPERYDELMEMLEDFILYMEAEKRLASTDPDKMVSQEDLMDEFGITQAELDAIDDVEIE
jgi:antitoxin StbD